MGFIERSALLVVVVATTSLVVAAPAPAASGECANESLRTETDSSQLPDCRAYELVTPAFKDGVAVASPPMISDDGSRLIATALGLFARAERATGVGGIGREGGLGADYELERGEAGWTTTPVTPPPLAPFPGAGMQGDASPDLLTTLWKLRSASQPPGEGDLYRREVTGNFVHLGPLQPLGEAPRFGNEGAYLGASDNLQNVFVTKGEDQGRWPGDTTTGSDSLYEYAGTEEAEPKLVGVANAGMLVSNREAHLISQCGTTLGGLWGRERIDTYNAISADPGTVFFTADACEGNPTVNELYARVGGARTVPISEPSLPAGQCTGSCASAVHQEAVFEGASADGSKAFFTTDQPLLNGDEEGSGTGPDLYEAELEDGALKKLVQVSRDSTTGKAAGVVSVARVSEDGSHVYYVAKGALTETPNGNGQLPEDGGYNLYSYDSDASSVAEGTSFVATLLTAAEEGELKDAVEQSEAAVLARGEVAEGKAAVAEQDAEIADTRGAVAAAERRCEGLSGKASSECAEELAELREALVELEAGLPELERGLTSAEAALAAYVARELAAAVSARDGVARSDNGRPFATTPDGRSLVFVGTGALVTAEGPAPGRQVFEYDAESGVTKRISLGQHSAAPVLSPQIIMSGYRETDFVTEAASSLTMSDDGSYVFFESPDALAPQASDDEVIGCLPAASEACASPVYAKNLYEYHAGRVSLIATVRDASGQGMQRLLATDPSGTDVFFTTADPLLAQDTDTQVDIYDARIGGGFSAPATQQACAGDGCQGPQSPQPTLPSPQSNGPPGVGNLIAPPATVTPLPVRKPTLKPLTRTQKLARALKACRKQPRRKRAACERKARQRYRVRSKSSRKARSRRSSRGSGR